MTELTELEKTLIIGFCAVGGCLLLFMAVIIIIVISRRRCRTEKKSTSDDEATVQRTSKPPALSHIPTSSTSTTGPPTTPSTDSDNLSTMPSPHLTPRVTTPQFANPTTPASSLMFPSMPSKYAGMRVGRTAWTAAYLPPPAFNSQAAQNGVDRGSAVFEERLDAFTDNERYRTHSSAGFDPYIARVQARPPRPPPSHAGSQSTLLGAVVDPVPYNNEPMAAGRMWPRSNINAPYSSAAMEAARRRTQELYNARRASRPSPASPALSQISAPSAGHQQIWSATSGKPQTGSYVISPRPFDSGDHQSAYYQESEISMYVAGNNDSPLPNSPQVPAERQEIGDAFRFLDEFEE